MAKTVNSAFDLFNKDYVNLKSSRTEKARSSRDWLITQLNSLPEKVDDFPSLYTEAHTKFGSFARNTKIRPLDDIDLILTFSAHGATYCTIKEGLEYYINVPSSATNLRKLCDDWLNSRKVVNIVVSALQEVEHYSSADVHRRQEAATLKLTSYEWNFDIVPAFKTTDGFYLIPDGAGHWKATDPSVDQSRTTSVNQKHNGVVLHLIRTLKYWNNHASMPTIPSYLFESMILTYCEERDSISEYIDYDLRHFWNALTGLVYQPIADPKGFQGDLNKLSYEDQRKISSKASDTYLKAVEAYNLEMGDKDQQRAIAKWREIFGDDFPQYG